MRYFFSILALALLMTACGSKPDTREIPEDLEGKRALLKEKRAELKELTDFVHQLEEAVAQQDPTLRAKEGQLVTTSSLVRSTFRHFVEIQGAVEADDLVDVTSEVAGRILKLTVEEGDHISQGQLVAELDLEQVERQIAEVETSLDLANTVFERQQRLWEKNIGSEMQYLEAKNSKERLEKSLETLRAQLDKSKVYAPISGVVERVALQSGELASPGMPIVEILNTNRLKVVADVPETYLRSIARGEMVTIEIPALDMEFRRRVTLIGRTIDPANRTFEVEVNIGNPGGRLKPNLLATVLINELTEEEVIVIPLEVVQEEVSGQKYVFVKAMGEKGPVAKKVKVKIGRSYEGDVIIESGLQGEEELILEGGRGLVDNAPIKVVNSKKEASNG
jgi:membrane fusion protein (multidrug efflux system)